jgi:hypothetical protein
VVAVAERNLALLSLPGLDARIQQLQALSDRFGKDSHRQALAAAARLRLTLTESDVPALPTHCYTADALDAAACAASRARPDLVLAGVAASAPVDLRRCSPVSLLRRCRDHWPAAGASRRSSRPLPGGPVDRQRRQTRAGRLSASAASKWAIGLRWCALRRA